MSFFQVENIAASYGNQQILHSISFGVEAGEIAGILGANGSGKTTLIKSICGILPHAGMCMLDGERLDALPPRKIAQRCSYIPQRSGIAIELSALDVVLMGFNARLSLLEQPNARMRASALAALEQVGLKDRLHDNYLTLSEGQKQLCMLARALVSGSKAMLLDEPESALDFRHRHHILSLIRSWIAQEQRCALISLHDPQLALRYCDRLLLIDRGQIADVLRPKQSELPHMEAALRRLYGNIELVHCEDRGGKSHLVMLNEGEECT